MNDLYPQIRRQTLLNKAKLSAIWDACLSLDVPGDLAELGVYRGGVVRLMATACPSRTVRAFDTFAGIPPMYDADLDGHKPGEFRASAEEVCRYLTDLTNVAIHPGTFPQSAADVDARFALVHLDADLYASTLAGLQWFWPRLSPGGSIVLDDWRWKMCRGVVMAVEEFFDNVPHGRDESVEHQLIVNKPLSA